MQRCLDHLLELREPVLKDPVKVDQVFIGVVDHFDCGFWLCPKDSGPSAERLAIKMMNRDKRQDVPQHVLLTPIIRYGGLQACFSFHLKGV